MDNYISLSILNKTNIFKNIHPNIITLLGFILNFIIYESIIQEEYNYLIIFLLGRWFADALDGNIARKYKKTSSIGNALDSISDWIMYLGMMYLICKIYEIDTKYLIIFYITLLTLNICYFNTFNKNKKEINNKDNSILSKINIFLSDNSIVVYIIYYYLIVHNESIKKLLNI